MIGDVIDKFIVTFVLSRVFFYMMTMPELIMRNLHNELLNNWVFMRKINGTAYAVRSFSDYSAITNLVTNFSLNYL